MSDRAEVVTPDVCEQACIATSYVAGVAAIHVDQYGVARISLYAEQIGNCGKMERVLSDRLVMPREVMCEIADHMHTAAMKARFQGEKDFAAARRKMA